MVLAKTIATRWKAVLPSPTKPFGLGPSSPAVRERSLELNASQPRSRGAGEGADPRIAVRGEAGEGPNATATPPSRSYRSFRVASPAIAKIHAMIQKRITIFGSSHPICSK